MNIVIWKDIKGYEGDYQISDSGDVRSLKFNKIKLMAKKLSHNGYYSVGLALNGVKKRARVSRLVAQAFISNPDEKSDVNHIDGNKVNNSVGNLEWCTKSENMQHACDTGLKLAVRGFAHGMSSLNELQIYAINMWFHKGFSQSALARVFNVSQSTMHRIYYNKSYPKINLNSLLQESGQ